MAKLKEATTQKRVPKLRFPEFKKAGEWEEKILGNVSEIVRGGSPRPINEFLTTEISGLNWLKIGDVDKEAKFVTHTEEKVIPAALSKTRVVNPGDLILSNSMSFGRPYILQIATCIHDGWIAVTKIDKTLDRDFLYYWIFAPNSQVYFDNNAAGSGVQNLNADIIKLLPTCLPSLPEQQKIADCLSSLDTLIAAHTQKHETLKTYKKGLLQQLFPAEGETVPKLRFPEFKKAGAWEEKKIANLAEITTGKKNTQDKVEKGLYPFFVRSDTIERINSYSFDGEAILTAGDGVGVGKVFHYINGKFEVHQRVYRLTNFSDNIYGKFLFEAFRKGFGYRVSLMSAKNSVDSVRLEMIADMIIPVPLSKTEQQKIADCLSSLDALITAQAQKIDSLKVHKKGLMQQLFPASEV